MNNRQTSKLPQMMTLRCLALIGVLLITACDGGIFGTGGPDEIIIDNDDNVSSSLPNQNESSTNGSDGSITGADVDAGAPPDTGSSTDGGSTDNSDAGTIGGADGGSDSGGSTTGGNDAGSTDEGMDTDSGSSTIGDTPSAVASGSDSGRFANNTATLDVADTQINLVNTTSLTLNVFETSINPATLLFDAAGVAPATLSGSAVLTNNATSLAIVDSTNVGDTLISYVQFDAAAATLTTIVVREANAEFSAIALATQTRTTDQGLSRLRVVQAGTLGDASVQTTMQLLSTGSNPGGINLSFNPISYASPQTDYLEFPAGDYELLDEQGRISSEALSLTGGSAYTVVLFGDGDNTILLLNDSAAGQ